MKPIVTMTLVFCMTFMSFPPSSCTAGASRPASRALTHLKGLEAKNPALLQQKAGDMNALPPLPGDKSAEKKDDSGGLLVLGILTGIVTTIAVEVMLVAGSYQGGSC